MKAAGGAPEFGVGGTPPAIRSDATLAAKDFFMVYGKYKAPTMLPFQYKRFHEEIAVQLLSHEFKDPWGPDAMEPEFREAMEWLSSRIDIDYRASNDIFKVSALKRIEQYLAWERDEPITQLPPDSSTKIITRRTVGISRTTARELSTTLSVERKGIGTPNLSSQLGSKISQSVSVSEQHEEARELTLSNPTQSYRRFALWRQLHILRICTVRARKVGPLGNRHVKVAWELDREFEFIEDGSVIVTYCDVAVG